MMKLIKLPFLAEIILGLAGGEVLVKQNAKDILDPNLVEHFKSVYRVQMKYKGFMRAILSSVRNGMLDSFMHEYNQVGKMDIPVLLFWGRDDPTIPLEHSTDICAAIPHLEFHLIEHCGHIPHYERPDAVNPLLLAFLRK